MLKKICIRAISLMMCFVMIVVSVSAANISFGDINGDGKTDLKDIVRLKKILAGLDESGTSADVNGDGEVNSLDLTIFKKYILGI